jgi:hypothetical protein
LTDSWKDKVRGVFVGLYAMRSQPAELREVLLNASLNSNEEKDYTDDVGPYSSDNTVARQNLYKGLKRRLEIIKDKPTLPMFVEYHKNNLFSIQYKQLLSYANIKTQFTRRFCCHLISAVGFSHCEF